MVNYYGTYVEIQVRTLSDELWGEVNHDFVYKMKRTEKKDMIEELKNKNGIIRLLNSKPVRRY